MVLTQNQSKKTQYFEKRFLDKVPHLLKVCIICTKEKPRHDQSPPNAERAGKENREKKKEKTRGGKEKQRKKRAKGGKEKRIDDFLPRAYDFKSQMI